LVLPEQTTAESFFLSGEPANTSIVADSLVLHGGISDRFRVLPKFVLLSDPRWNPDAGIGYQSFEVLESWEIPLEERYPMQLRNMMSPSISGFSVIGRQSRNLPWRVVKAMWDGDALHIKNCRGVAKASNVYWENVQDGFGPIGELDSWVLKNAYMRYIRDDAIENDDLIPGEITNCLIDECFVFLSQRSEPQRITEAVTVIRDCVVHVSAQPHDGVANREWRDANIVMGKDGIGRAPGSIFKWDEGAGRVDVKNTVFRMDAATFNDKDDMAFPPGTYENVTLVWLGEDDYPTPLPEGVTVTRDLSKWQKARHSWIERMPDDHPAAKVLKNPAVGSATPLPFQIKEFAVNTDGAVTLTWFSKPERSYSLRYTPDPARPMGDWIDVESKIKSMGDATLFTTEPFPESLNEIYLVVIEE
jgi:hypothetical protein